MLMPMLLPGDSPLLLRVLLVDAVSYILLLEDPSACYVALVGMIRRSDNRYHLQIGGASGYTNEREATGFSPG